MRMPYEYLMSHFHYDPHSGKFTRIYVDDKLRGKRVINREISAVSDQGYLVTTYNKRLVRVHILIVHYVTGEYPEGKLVDHINGDRKDNRWVNLRVVDRKDGQRNLGVAVTNKSGSTGVYWYQPLQKYQAQITTCGKKYHLGYFEKFEDAVEVRREAEKRFNFHPNHGERPSWRG